MNPAPMYSMLPKGVTSMEVSLLHPTKKFLPTLVFSKAGGKRIEVRLVALERNSDPMEDMHRISLISRDVNFEQFDKKLMPMAEMEENVERSMEVTVRHL